MKIVIIEDERDLGILLRNFLVNQLNLKSTGDNIEVATSLSEGIACVTKLCPDWVFVDNNLPDGKGIDEIENIKDLGRAQSISIVMMSAMTNLKEEALRKGADYFLDKPISFVEVRKIMSAAM